MGAPPGRLRFVERWASAPDALLRVGSNAANRGLGLVESLEEVARGVEAGLVPDRLDRFAVAREVVGGWVDARRDQPDPASASGGLASAAYLRTRLHELYRPPRALDHALVVVRARGDATTNLAYVSPTPVDAAHDPAATDLRLADLACETAAEHGPGVRLLLARRDDAASLASAVMQRATPAWRVWVEPLPFDRRHVDRVLAELRAPLTLAPTRDDRVENSTGRADRWITSWTGSEGWTVSEGGYARWRRDPAVRGVPVEDHHLALALVEHARSRSGTRLAAARYGHQRRRAGATFFDVLAEVGAIVDTLGRRSGHVDCIATAARLCAAWAGTSADDEAAAGVLDPVTGLPNRAYLRRRILELSRAPGAEGLRLVSARLAPGPSGLDGLDVRLRAADFMRWVFAGAETVAVASNATISAIVTAEALARVAPRCRNRSEIVTVRTFRLVPGLDAVGA